MQFIDVVCYGSNHALCKCILPAAVQVLPQSHVFLYHSKASFGLDTAIHPQLCPVFRRDALQRFLPFFLHHLRDLSGAGAAGPF